MYFDVIKPNKGFNLFIYYTIKDKFHMVKVKELEEAIKNYNKGIQQQIILCIIYSTEY